MSSREPVLGDLGGWEIIATRDGGTIRVASDHRKLAVIAEDEAGEERARVELSSPVQGIGGTELFLSREERYLALFVFSGQGEVGYELFALRPALRHIGGLPYVRGAGFGPAFSADETQIGLATTLNSGLVVEEAELDADERLASDALLEWVEVRVHTIETGAIELCTVSAQLCAGFPREGDDSYWPSRLEIAGEVRFDTGWGAEVRIPLPLPPSVTVRGPRARTSA